MRTALICLMLLACDCGDDTTPADAGADTATTPDSGDRDADRDADVGSARIEVGTGLTDFVEVEDGDDVELVMGSQGGWHVDVALRLYGMEPMDMLIAIHGFDTSSGDEVTIPIERVLTRRRVRDLGDHWLRLGDQAVFMITEASQASDRDLRLEVSATPLDGPTVQAEKRFHVVDRLP